MTTKLDKETLNYDPLLRCEEHDEENCISCACKLILAYRTALLEAVRRLHRTNWGWVDTVRALGAAVKEAQTERDEARAALELARERLQIDPGGSDKIDELEQAVEMLRARAEKAEAERDKEREQFDEWCEERVADERARAEKAEAHEREALAQRDGMRVIADAAARGQVTLVGEARKELEEAKNELENERARADNNFEAYERGKALYSACVKERDGERIRAEVAEQKCIDLSERVQRLEEAARGVSEIIEGALQHHDTKGKGGQQCDYHGPFACVVPSNLRDLRDIVRVLRAALEEK